MRPPFARIRALQSRFLAINLPLVLLAVTLLFGLFEYGAYGRAMNDLRQKLDRIVASQAAILSESVWSLDVERIQLILHAAADDPEIRGAVVHDDRGNFLAAVGDGDTAKWDPEISAERPIIYDTGQGQETIGHLELAHTDTRVPASMKKRGLLAAALAVLSVLSVVLSAMIANRWTIGLPLARPTESIERTESGGSRHPVEWRSDDEVGAVVKAFNQMQARQQLYEDELRKTRDPLERRVAERTAELARARDAAEAANAAKTGFLANMSHELRTPLNAVIGFGEVLEGELLGTLSNPRYREYAADIRKSGTHLLALINDLLDLSKAEAGKLDLQESVFDLGEVAAAALAMVRPRADDVGVALVSHTPDDLPWLRTDDRKIKQVLLNLLTNAVKFTPRGGRVMVDLRVAEGGLEIEVRDTGIDIAEKDLNRVLQPFAQVDSALSRKYDGTGLGLPLVKSLAELHGGELEIASPSGAGTCVTVRLPRDRLEDAVAEAEPPAPTAQAS